MNRVLRSTVSLVASLGLVHGALAQTYFSGTVLDADNQPIVGATIQAGHSSPPFVPFTVDGQASTDAQGHYAITALGAGDGSGKYVLLARAAGRISLVYPNLPCGASSCPPPGFPPTVTVPNSAVDFTLYHPGSISGHVRRTDTNADVAGLTITAGGQSSTLVSTTTDANGNYVIGYLMPDSYLVQSGYGQVPDQYALLPQMYAGHDFDAVSSVSNADLVSISDGANATGIDFALDPGGAIQGSVMSSIDSEALPTQIGIQRLTPASSGSGFYIVATTLGFTDQPIQPPPPGQYIIQPLLPGTFKLLFSAASTAYLPNYFADATSSDSAQAVTVTGTATTGGVDAHLVPLQTIAGTITDAVSGQPVPNIVVHGGPPLPGFGELEDIAQSRTDGQGKYLLQGLTPGSHYVWIYYSPGYLDQVYPNALGCCFAPTGSQQVALAAGQQLTGIDMAITRGAYALGQIHDADSGAPPPNASLIVYDTNGNQLQFDTVDASGQFKTDTLPTGDYYFAAFIGGNQIFYPNYRCNSGTTCDLSFAQRLSFSSATQYLVDFPIPHLDVIFRGGFD